MNKPIKIIKKLKIDPMLNKSNKYPTCKSGSLNCSEAILKKPYKIINKAETTSNSINKELVFEILGRSSWDALAPFYKFQQAWVNTAYNTFKDFDIYLILNNTVKYLNVN